MNAVIGLTDLALQHTQDSRIHDYLRKISNASHSLLRLINDILDFSKIDAGKLELETTDFYLRDVFDHLSDMFRAKTVGNQIELVICASEECFFELNGDAFRLEQILMNLLGNAFKFTREGEIEVRATTGVEFKEQVVLHFEVRDTGIGLSEKEQFRLFDAFTQADSSTTRKYGGRAWGWPSAKNWWN